MNVILFFRPMWEDSTNKRGGKWLLNLQRANKPDLDTYWLDTVSNIEI